MIETGAASRTELSSSRWQRKSGSVSADVIPDSLGWNWWDGVHAHLPKLPLSHEKSQRTGIFGISKRITRSTQSIAFMPGIIFGSAPT